MGTSKRYAAHYDKLASERIATAPTGHVITLHPPAWGPEPIEWVEQSRPSVWAWISWSDRIAERTPAIATGWNDRVVIVEWDTDRGTRSAVVWRNAVSVRGTTKTPRTTRPEG